MKKTIKYIDGAKVTVLNDPNCDLDDDLMPEYDLSKMQLQPNPYAQILKQQKEKMILLDPDIAVYFKSSKQVNNFLRNQINLFQNTITSGI
jgi:hypothetical protein